jgi:hypothetical protein
LAPPYSYRGWIDPGDGLTLPPTKSAPDIHRA